MERTIHTWPTRLLARPWLLAFVPINAATSGFGVALPLLILIPLAGSWSDVAIAASLYNGAVILSSMFWGYVSDRYPTRRRLLLLNYVGFAVVYFALAEATSLPVLFVLYTLVGVLAPAGASASNLLILERFPEHERPGAFASFQEMSIIGAMVGLLVGFFWLLADRPLQPLFFVLAALAALSVVAVWIGVRDGPVPVPTAAVSHHPESLISRLHVIGLRGFIPYFPRRPSFNRHSWQRLRRWFREEMHHELPLILLATLLFNLASNLFNISYVPYLERGIGLSASAIFLVNFANNLAQGLSFPSSGTLTSRLGADRLVQRSTYVRSLGYLAVAGFTFVPLAISSAYGANLLAFAALGAAIAFYSTASSIILFRALEGRDAGTLLGVNSALGGAAAVAGAILSGVLSIFGSYRLTFLVAAGALLVSLPLWTAAQVAYDRRRHPRTSPAAPRPIPEAAVAAETD
ncbi:MAG: MFS transporter [Thermoplasmata archaeon]|nr:MFS transporter [Thermoplasmata archaeon]